MKKIKLSVVIATYNEEKNLPSCLQAVKDWIDEIIIFDGQSTDKTAEIGKKYGAKVFITTNKPIFHINKQMAIDKARGEWILQLDADEIVDDELRKEILQIARHQSINNHQPVAYYLPRKNYFLGRWLKKGGQYPDHVIRFFKKGKAYLPCQSVHEQMVVDGEVGYLRGHLLHYTAPDFSRYLENSNRYTSLTAAEFEKEKLKINPLSATRYLIFKPIAVFFSLYFRHKGILDGFPGFVFSLFSGLHYPIAFLKYLELKKCKI